MGTSSAYGGARRSSPLLPPWAEDPPDSPSEAHDTEETGDTNESERVPNINYNALRNSRIGFAGYASGQGGSLQKAVGEYVRAHRTSRYATRATSAGRRSTTSLGGFLSSVARQGIHQTLRDFDLSHFIGESVHSVVSAILDKIAPRGDLREEAIARRAATDTLAEIYDNFDLDNGIENLDRMTERDIGDAVRSSVANHIFRRIVHQDGADLEMGTATPEQAEKAEREARDYIYEAVRVDFGDNDILHMNWDGSEASDMIDRIIDDAHVILKEKLSE